MQLSRLDVKPGEEGEGRTVVELITNTLIIILVRPAIYLFTSKHFWKYKFHVTSSKHLKTDTEKLNTRYRSISISSQTGCSNR